MAVVHETHAVELSATTDSIQYDGDSIEVSPMDDGLELRSIAPSGAVVGTEIVIVNVSATRSFMLPHASANGSMGGRFFTPDGADIILAPFEQVWGVLREASGREGWWLQL